MQKKHSISAFKIISLFLLFFLNGCILTELIIFPFTLWLMCLVWTIDTILALVGTNRAGPFFEKNVSFLEAIMTVGVLLWAIGAIVYTIAFPIYFFSWLG